MPVKANPPARKVVTCMTVSTKSFLNPMANVAACDLATLSGLVSNLGEFVRKYSRPISSPDLPFCEIAIRKTPQFGLPHVDKAL